MSKHSMRPASRRPRDARPSLRAIASRANRTVRLVDRHSSHVTRPRGSAVRIVLTALALRTAGTLARHWLCRRDRERQHVHAWWCPMTGSVSLLRRPGAAPSPLVTGVVSRTSCNEVQWNAMRHDDEVGAPRGDSVAPEISEHDVAPPSHRAGLPPQPLRPRRATRDPISLSRESWHGVEDASAEWKLSRCRSVKEPPEPHNSRPTATPPVTW